MLAFCVGEVERFATRDDRRLENQQALLHPLTVTVRIEINIEIEPAAVGIIAGLNLCNSGRRHAGGHPGLNPLNIFRARFALHLASITRGPLAVSLLPNGRDQRTVTIDARFNLAIE